MEKFVILETVGGRVVSKTYFLDEERMGRVFKAREKMLKETQGIWYQPYMLSSHKVEKVINVNGEKKEVIVKKPVDFARFGWPVR